MKQSGSLFSVENENEASGGTPKSASDESHSRTIDSIIASPSAELAKCILSWLISAPRPLSMDELTEAVKLDINQTLPSPPSQHLESIIGPFIAVDGQFRVHIADETTSTLLTQPREDAGVWIDRSTTHSRIAEICLDIFGGTQFTPPKLQEGSLRESGKALPRLSAYAAANFAYHLSHALSAPNDHLALLNKFLQTNVLTWIERLAESDDLVSVIGGIRGIKAYLETQRNRRVAGEKAQVEMAVAWMTEIYRFIALFHSAILTMPSSVHLLLPQFCPRNSIIGQVFGTPTEDLKIVGHLDEDWDDRLTCYQFPGMALSVACCKHLVAIGVLNDGVHLYNLNTFELVAALQNKRGTRLLAFDSRSSFLVSCNQELLELWNVRQQSQPPCRRVWQRVLNFVPEGLELSPDEKTIVLFNPEKIQLVTVSVTDGLGSDVFFLYGPPDPSNDPDDWTQRRARVRLNASHSLAAVLCANSSVVLWDLKLHKMTGVLEAESGTENAGCLEEVPSRRDMLFHPISEVELLAISGDWGVATYHPRTLEQTAQCCVSDPVYHLAATSDGRLLAAGDGARVIHLFLFETLQLLYRIQPPDLTHRLSNITFSSDNSRLFAIQGPCCNVWEPSVLKSGGSLLNEVPVEPQAPLLEPRQREKISFIHPTEGRLFFVGRSGGAVEAWDGETGTEIQELRPEFPSDVDWVGGRVQCLDWNESQQLLLVSNFKDYIVSRLSFHHNNNDNNHTTFSPPTTITTLLRHHIPTKHAIFQALLSPSGSTAVFRTLTDLILLAIPPDNATTTTTTTTTTTSPPTNTNTTPNIITTLTLPLSTTTDTTSCRVDQPPRLTHQPIELAHHPTNPHLLVATTPTHIHLLDWHTLARRSPDAGIPLCGVPPNSGYKYGYGVGVWNSPVWFGRNGGRNGGGVAGAGAGEGAGEGEGEGEGRGYLARLVTAPLSEPGHRVVGVAVVDMARAGLGGGGDGDDDDAGGTQAEMRLLGCAALETLRVPALAVIGVRAGVLYFFDAAGWVCSVELGQARCYRRHFFVPPTWNPPGSGVVKVPVALVSGTVVAFSRGEGLVVFLGGLGFGEEVPLGKAADSVDE